MEELEQAGISGYVGKVNMDISGGERLQETTEGSKAETLRWLRAVWCLSLMTAGWTIL